MSRAFFIDAAKQEIVEVDLPLKSPGTSHSKFMQENLARLQGYVGGHIEIAFGITQPTGEQNYLMVDEDGLHKPQRYFFRFKNLERPYPFAGNGLFIGTDAMVNTGGEEPEFIGQQDCTIPIEVLREQVIWVNREQADAMFRANASDPAIAYHTIDPETGELSEPHVLQRFGELHRNMPRPTDEEDNGNG